MYKAELLRLPEEVPNGSMRHTVFSCIVSTDVAKICVAFQSCWYVTTNHGASLRLRLHHYICLRGYLSGSLEKSQTYLNKRGSVCKR